MAGIGVPSSRVGGRIVTGPNGLMAPTPSKAAGSGQGSATGIGAQSMPTGAQTVQGPYVRGNVMPGSAATVGQGAPQPGAGAGGGTNPLAALLGGGGASASAGSPGAAPINYNPAEMNITSQNNPQLEALQRDAAGLRSNLAAGSDQDATLALQRQRDLNSGAAQEYGAEAAARGTLGSGSAQQDLMKRVVQPGQQQLGALNASLAADARSKQMQALGLEAGITGQQAAVTQAQQNFGLQSWQAREQAQRAAAQLQVQQQQNATGNNLQLASLLGNFYSGGF